MKGLSESYDVPLETMTTCYPKGGPMSIRRSGGSSREGLFACLIDPAVAPKTNLGFWTSCNLRRRATRSHSCMPFPEAAVHGVHSTLPDELKKKLQQKNLGLDYRTLDSAVAKGGDIKYIDFRKDWSPHFKRLCIMPDGRLVETGGLDEFAQLHGITAGQARGWSSRGARWKCRARSWLVRS